MACFGHLALDHGGEFAVFRDETSHTIGELTRPRVEVTGQRATDHRVDEFAMLLEPLAQQSQQPLRLVSHGSGVDAPPGGPEREHTHLQRRLRELCALPALGMFTQRFRRFRIRHDEVDVQGRRLFFVDRAGDIR